MAAAPPATPPAEPGEPSNRWPWIALGLGLLIILVAAGFYFLNRPRTVNITVEGTATANPVARAGTASPPPTLVPPTLPASATLAPTATPLPSPTPLPATPTPIPPPTPAATQPAAQAAPPAAAPPAAPAAPAAGAPTTGAPTESPASAVVATAAAAVTGAVTPTVPAAAQPTAAGPTPAAKPSPPAAPSPTPFAGQVANPGGAGNTRADFDTAYGPPAGETPEHLVVYRKGTAEYHVGFVPDPQGRAALVVEVPAPGQQPWSLDQAAAEARKLLPRDAQPPNPPQEGNDQFVVERYTSQSLAQALPPQAFTANNGQPGQFMVVYVRDPQQQGRITRLIVGPGNDPQALIQQGR